MPGDLSRKDVCNANLVDEKEKLCPVRADLGTTILSTVSEDKDRKGLFIFKFHTSKIYNVIDTTTI